MVVKPSQMVKLDLTAREWQRLKGDVGELEVSCTIGGKA
jgi:hypothetical protein